MERLEHPELLGNHQRLMVRKHHAPGTHPQRRRHARQVRNQHGRRGARDPRHVVVLGHPVPPVAQPLYVPCQVERVPERLTDRRTGSHRSQIEHRKRRRTKSDHHSEYGDGLEAARRPEVVTEVSGC
jgi:hypothetical protein